MNARANELHRNWGVGHFFKETGKPRFYPPEPGSSAKAAGVEGGRHFGNGGRRPLPIAPARAAAKDRMRGHSADKDRYSPHLDVAPTRIFEAGVQEGQLQRLQSLHVARSQRNGAGTSTIAAERIARSPLFQSSRNDQSWASTCASHIDRETPPTLPARGDPP